MTISHPSGRFAVYAATFVMVGLSEVSAAEPPRYSFPRDVSVLDAKRDFGAVGDGRTDDTEALQKALVASSGRGQPRRGGKTHVLFLPNGVYRLTKTLVVEARLGPWLYGESRDGVVLKLDDGVKGAKSVLRTHPIDDGPTSADWFMRNLRRFTVDVGRNPEVDGIRYYATNSGCLQDVRVVGHGKIGVNAGFLGQSGPNLVQDVEVEGFETGILSQWIWGQTLSRATIKNCRKVGLEVSANVVAVEDLVVRDTPLAVDVKVPNDWGHWGGVVALVGGRFSGGDPHGPAIRNHSILYARDVAAEGFDPKRLVESRSERGDVAGNRLDEYVSSAGRKLYDDAPERSLGLPIRSAPVVPWEHDHTKWFCLDDHGAAAGDGADDSDAIEKALATAAAKRKTVVYFRGCGGPEPNWFVLRRPIRVPAPIRLVFALGWGRILGEQEGGFVVDDGSADVVKFQNLDSFGGPPIRLINASANKTLVVESCGVRIVGDGGGDVFATDCPSHLELKKPGQKCWARQLNPEGDSDAGLVQNRGGDLWCLGVKHEGRGVRFSVRDGGRTEILGLFNYGGTKEELDPRPCFDVVDASFSVAGLREIAFESHTALNKVREKRGAESRILDKRKEGGWIGWPLYSGFKPAPKAPAP